MSLVTSAATSGEELLAQLAQRTNGLAFTNLPALGFTNGLALTNSAGLTNGVARRQGFGNRRFNQPRVELARHLRDAMRRETEMYFAGIVHDDRPVTELIESDYTFLNEKLAKLHGITNVAGPEMRRVTLPADSPRGDVLTLESLAFP